MKRHLILLTLEHISTTYLTSISGTRTNAVFDMNSVSGKTLNHIVYEATLGFASIILRHITSDIRAIVKLHKLKESEKSYMEIQIILFRRRARTFALKETGVDCTVINATIGSASVEIIDRSSSMFSFK